MGKKQTSSITKIEVRMYRMGTGDCFALKFFKGEIESFKMIIDAGTWSGSREVITPYVEDLLSYVGNSVDVLVVTHEHKDHVHAFDVCEDLFRENLSVDQVWMAWTEDDSNKKVGSWKKKYGDKKFALAEATHRLSGIFSSNQYKSDIGSNKNSVDTFSFNNTFSAALHGFSELHNSLNADGKYVGGLAGMEFVKKKLEANTHVFLNPGEIISDISGAEGIKFYILGPPLDYTYIKLESGGEGESYDHNKEISDDDLFSATFDPLIGPGQKNPFDPKYESIDSISSSSDLYNDSTQGWRKIEEDWLMSAGSLALRMNSMTNNLSLAFAIEFEGSRKVLLFPGDAEFGSWKSWHSIEWDLEPTSDNVPLVEDLLRRTVFYKVAHHLSHNGTAKRLGLDMMTHKDLVAMATLDYSVISKQWLNTMPNKMILKDLITKSKGRLLIMNTEGLFYDSEETITVADRIHQEQQKLSVPERKKFDSSTIWEELFIQFTISE